jgi:hypothetical protein
MTGNDFFLNSQRMVDNTIDNALEFRKALYVAFIVARASLMTTTTKHKGVVVSVVLSAVRARRATLPRSARFARHDSPFVSLPVCYSHRLHP